MKQYNVVELFKSIQSEGINAGRAASFVRFYGCNLACKFGENFKCDEPLHTELGAVEHKTLDDILAYCKGIRLVVITGGEPSINDINPLIEALQDQGHEVAVETNGYKLIHINKANCITYSPKVQWSEDKYVMGYGFHELKLLASEEFPPNEQQWRSIHNKFIQPIGTEDGWDLDNVRWCADWVIAHPDWKLSLQTHKIYGGQ